jgi:hypothetical protein
MIAYMYAQMRDQSVFGEARSEGKRHHHSVQPGCRS